MNAAQQGLYPLKTRLRLGSIRGYAVFWIMEPSAVMCRNKHATLQLVRQQHTSA